MDVAFALKGAGLKSVAGALDEGISTLYTTPIKIITATPPIMRFRFAANFDPKVLPADAAALGGAVFVVTSDSAS